MSTARSDKLIFVISDDVIAVRGVYDPNEAERTPRYTADIPKTGELFKTFITDLAVGDIVVVESGSRTGYSTIKITEVNSDFDFDSDEPCRWVTQRIDTDAHEALREREQAAIGQVKTAQRKTQRAELIRQMIGGEDAAEAMDAIALSFNAADKDEG